MPQSVPLVFLPQAQILSPFGDVTENNLLKHWQDSGGLFISRLEVWLDIKLSVPNPPSDFSVQGLALHCSFASGPLLVSADRRHRSETGKQEWKRWDLLFPVSRLSLSASFYQQWLSSQLYHLPASYSPSSQVPATAREHPSLRVSPTRSSGWWLLPAASVWFSTLTSPWWNAWCFLCSRLDLTEKKTRSRGGQCVVRAVAET